MNTTKKADIGKVLVAVDGSPSSLEALRIGHQWAALLGVELVGVTAWQPFRHGVLPASSVHPQQFAEQLVANSVLAAFRDSNAPSVRVIAVEGDAAESLIELSVGADLLVLGSRGHSGLPGMLLGSVSSRCAAHARCPVLVVHAPSAVGESSPAKSDRDASSVHPDARMVVTL